MNKFPDVMLPHSKTPMTTWAVIYHRCEHERWDHHESTQKDCR